jgi:hypothetical protein
MDDLNRFYAALFGGDLLGPDELAEMRRTVPTALVQGAPGQRGEVGEVGEVGQGGPPAVLGAVIGLVGLSACTVSLASSVSQEGARRSWPIWWQIWLRRLRLKSEPISGRRGGIAASVASHSCHAPARAWAASRETRQ